ncbi:MAG: DUF3795 domain-containing protein [Clostridia bacterium]|nr:DUF3795 domain-containing protein [Clostridia bacterium]
MNKMIAICGLNCEKCDAYLATKNNDEKLREITAKKWSELNGVDIQPKDINCEGCRANGVKTVYCENLCEIRQCALSKGIQTCKECSNIKICQKLAPIISTSKEARKNLKLDG